MGDPDEFRGRMLLYAGQTRELKVKEGEIGQKPVTKIGGEPWWPDGVDRPKCPDGHYMNFVAQILLSDAPLDNMPENALLSFHYCEECTFDGRMFWGWVDRDNQAYDLSILHGADWVKPDGRGMVVRSWIKPHGVTFRDVLEVPGGLLEDTDIELVHQPKDFPCGDDDFDEYIYPGLKHIHRSKIGGWPSWAQAPDWPVTPKGEKYRFLAQFDWWLFCDAPWCSGGYAYLFITESMNGALKAEMVVQTT